MVGVVGLLVLAPALPSRAQFLVNSPAHPTRAELVRVSPWTRSVQISGLSSVNAAQVEGLWGEFVAGVPAHAACLLETPPRIEAKSGMAPRAAYAPSTSTLFVRPGDLDRLVVFHELAHHLDFTCGAAEAVGADLRAAQGMSPDKPWWKHGSPVTWPAEYFANAVAIALGEESRHDVTTETVEVVEQWLGRAAPARVAVGVAPPRVGYVVVGPGLI